MTDNQSTGRGNRTHDPMSAQLFRTLALGVKLALLPFAGKQVFEIDQVAVNRNG